MMRILIFLELATKLYTVRTSTVDPTVTGHLTVLNSKLFVPGLLRSLIESRQLVLSSFTTVSDCSIVCINTIECITAVYNHQTKICSMYRSNAVYQGSLISGSIDDFTIILNERSPLPPMIYTGNINVTAVWNTTIGGDSQYSYSGTGIGSFWPTEQPEKVFDGDYNTSYCNHGPCTAGSFPADSCGTKTGIVFTYPRGPVLLKSFRMITFMNTARDPVWISIEGSNQNSSTLSRGSSWTLIYNGSSGLDIDPGRQQPGEQQYLWDNINGYASYRILTLRRRSPQVCAHYSELELFAL